MHTPGQSDGPQPTISAENRTDLLDALDNVTAALGPSEWWALVRPRLDAASKAVADGDDDAVRRAAGQLDEMTDRGPKIGSEATRAPKDIQDKANHVKHSVYSLGAPDAERSDKAQRGGRDDGRRTSS